MMKYKLIFLFVLFIQLLPGQEQEQIPILQNPAKINDYELKRILDSISITKLHPNFFENSVYSSFDTTRTDTTYINLAEYKRMQMLFGSYDDFKRKFLALEIKDQTIDLHIPKIIGSNEAFRDPTLSANVSLGSPISFFYNTFSKEAQSLQKYYALRDYEPSQRHINAKYNYAKVKQWTGLKDDELTKFVLYCHFEDTFLLHVSDYELIETVLIKLTEFQAIEDSCNYQQ